MSKIEYLFLCHEGAKRSPTAASVAHEIAESKNLDIEMNYGAANAIGKNNEEYMAKHLDRYEKIFVMQNDIQEKLENLGISKGKIVCLNIKDIYERHEPQLRKILKRKLEKLI